MAPRIIPAMLLALDIGNTNVTVGLLRNGALIATRRAATAPRATADELEVLLDELLHLDGASFGDVDAISCASVVPALTAHVETIAARRERSLTLALAGTVPLAIRAAEARGALGAEAVGQAVLHVLVVIQVGLAVSLLNVQLQLTAAIIALAFYTWGGAVDALRGDASGRAVAAEFSSLMLIGLVAGLLLTRP